jgi:hypothetical protein
MKLSGRRGFVLITVVGLIALAGTALMLLTHASNSMRFDCQRMYSQAVRRNLNASGRAWAQHQIEKTRGQPPVGEKGLATDELAIPAAQLKVSITAKGREGFQVRVATSHRIGRRTSSSKAEYLIPAAP